MLQTILSTLTTMGWLGIILAILVLVNTVCSTVYNICTKKECFCWKKLFKGLAKAAIFYVSASLLSVALTMLPFINEMITNSLGVVLVSNETLNLLSGVGVLGVVVSVIIVQAKKAIQGITNLANMSSDVETITWDVEDEEERKI